MIAETIYTLIGTVAGGQVYPGRIPQKTPPPFVKHFRVGTSPTRTKSGPALHTIRYQISVFAKTLTEAEAIADTIRQTLDDYRGTEANKIDSIIFINQYETFDHESDLEHVVQDYQIRKKL